MVKLSQFTSFIDRGAKDIALEGASRIKVSWKHAQTETSFEGRESLTLVKFDPGQLRVPPEDARKIEELVHQGVQYSVVGEGTPESLTEKLNQLLAKLQPV